MSSEIAITVKNLSKCYEIYSQPHDRLKQSIFPKFQRLANIPTKQYFTEFWALNDVSFQAKKGETVGIIGQNGCGKSTLLQIICGTLSPTRGSIDTNGRIAALLELGSGFNPEYTGRENVYMNATILGLTRKEIDFLFSDIVAFADIGPFIEQPLKTYSSGMMMRLAFAVQAMIHPDIFVIDEALAVGDEKFQRKCFARLEDLKERGTSILFVSHSPSAIIELCDKVLLLAHGARLLYSTPHHAIRAYQKLIYAPPEEAESLMCEYRIADRETALERDRDLNNLASERRDDSPIAFTDHSVPDFDPSLLPETTTVYPVQGAKIEMIQIIDNNGRVVNLLQPGGYYQFIVSGYFFEGCPNNVFFGIHIRSISGLVITGQRYPEQGNYLALNKTNSAFKISFGFKIDLLPGVYFVGSGIWSSQHPSCVHRILDSIMFRVNPNSRQISFGYADMSTKVPDVELF